MNQAKRLAALASAAALALGCGSTAKPAETPRQSSSEQVDQAAGYSEEIDREREAPNGYDSDGSDPIWDDMGDFDDTDFRDDDPGDDGAGPGGDEDSGRGE